MQTKDLLNIYKVITKELVDNLNKKFKKLQDELVKQGITNNNNRLDYYIHCYNIHNEIITEYVPTSNGSKELLYEDGYISISIPTTDVESLLRYLSISELDKLNNIVKAVIDIYKDKSKEQIIVEL